VDAAQLGSKQLLVNKGELAGTTKTITLIATVTNGKTNGTADFTKEFNVPLTWAQAPIPNNPVTGLQITGGAISLYEGDTFDDLRTKITLKTADSQPPVYGNRPITLDDLVFSVQSGGSYISLSGRDVTGTAVGSAVVRATLPAPVNGTQITTDLTVYVVQPAPQALTLLLRFKNVNNSGQNRPSDTLESIIRFAGHPYIERYPGGYPNSACSDGHTGQPWGWDGPLGATTLRQYLYEKGGYGREELHDLAGYLQFANGEGLGPNTATRHDLPVSVWSRPRNSYTDGTGYSVTLQLAEPFWFKDQAGNLFGYLDPAGGPITGAINKLFQVNFEKLRNDPTKNHWEIQIHTDVDSPDWGTVTIDKRSSW
jgi:hypothetical protein